MTDDTATVTASDGKSTLTFCVDPWPKNLPYWNYSKRKYTSKCFKYFSENASGADIIRTKVKIAHITKGMKGQCAKLVVEVFTVSVDIAKSSSCLKGIGLRPRTRRKNSM